MTVGSGISFGGLASGLDTNAIITQLVAVEEIPINALRAQQDEARQRLDLVGNFGDLVRDLQERAEVLADASQFFAFGVSSSPEGLANVTVSDGAEAGSHSLTVIQTAAVDRHAFDGVADAERNLATSANRRVQFDVNGTTYDISIDQDNSSLFDIRNAINSEAGEDVSASVVNSGTLEDPSYQLVIAANESGTANAIANLSTNVQGLNLSAPNISNITVGRDAQAEINGLTITRSNNDFSDVIPGVSIDLIAADSTTEVTIAVEADREVIRTQIDDFVSAFNDVIGFINTQSTFSEDNGAGGLLFGDSILTSVAREIRAGLEVPIENVLSDTTGFANLSSIGIRQQGDGTLLVDETVFTERLNEDLGALADLFVDSDGFDNNGADPEDPDFTTDFTEDDGIADNLVRRIERLFGTFEGGVRDPLTSERAVIDSLFRSREQAINSTIDRLGDQIEDREVRLVAFEERLILRFAALEDTIGGLNAQGAALGQALLSLPNPQQ